MYLIDCLAVVAKPLDPPAGTNLKFDLYTALANTSVFYSQSEYFRGRLETT